MKFKTGHQNGSIDKPMKDSPLTFSVVIPVRNDSENLGKCLTALSQSRERPGEIIVVDDASSDDSGEIARSFGARVIELEKNLGPGLARNAGARIARYDHLCFVDADVAVQPEALTILASNFLAEPEIDAVFGSYDRRMGKRNIASQYRNLLHHSVHQEGKREATTFWAGLGAIRRDSFEALGGFSPDAVPQIEDIELGRRLHRGGGRIRLDRTATATHLKEWTLWSMLVCDVTLRAIPWARLILSEGTGIPNDLNLKRSQRVCAVLACILVLLLALGAWHSPAILLVPIVCGAGLWLADDWTRVAPIPSWVKAVAVIGLLVLMLGVANLPLLKEPLAQMGVAGSFVLTATIVLLNRSFYRVIRERNPALLVAAFPLHIMYYLYSTGAFLVGFFLHLVDKKETPIPGSR